MAGLPSGQAKVGFFGSEPTEANYLIMDTDYDSYSMVYSCDPNSIAMYWILSRTPTMDEATIDQLNAQAAQMLPNYDWSIATLDRQGGTCRYSTDLLHTNDTVGRSE